MRWNTRDRALVPSLQACSHLSSSQMMREVTMANTAPRPTTCEEGQRQAGDARGGAKC